MTLLVILGRIIPVICEKRRQFVLFLDGERNVKWCSAIKVLNNGNLKGDILLKITESHVSLLGCFKKSKHNVLIIENTS